MEIVDDGSASPESADENHTSEDQTLSKNRSKRKPSKTQIKHIAQDAFSPPNLNGQIHRPARDSKNDFPNTHNHPPTERRKMATSQPIVSSSNLNCNTSASNYIDHNTDGLFTSGNQSMDQCANNIQQEHSRGSRRVKWSPKVVKQPSVTNTAVQPGNIQSSLPGIVSSRSSMGQSHTSSANTSPRSMSGRPSPCYPCAICGKVFRVPSRFDSHMLGHSKGKPFCCNTCGKMFASQEKLDRHLPVHNCDRHAAFTCETCGKVCVNWRAYLYHIKAKHTESGGKRFSCNVKMSPLLSVQKSDPNSSYTCASCGKICVNWRAYVYHQRSRHSETDGKNFSCNLCGRQFYTRHRLKKHTLGHEKGKHHCCHVCGKLFESSKKLTTHSLVHNLSGMHDQNLQCGDCGRKYSDWIPFKQHMKTHGAEGVCYPCGHCEETFPTQYDLEKHRRVHKQFQCEFCDRFFRSASVLSVHLRVHTGERPYRCGLCDRDFSQSCVLKVHMRTHAKEERYECKLCGLVLHDVMGYFRHHVAHLEEGNLQCEECGKMFDNINNKNRHMATHRDRDGRQCHVCGKEFGRVSHLEAHMLSHSDSDPIPLTCKVCSKAFSSQDLLTAHYSTHMTGDLSSSDAALSVSAHDSSPLFCGVCGKMFKDREYLNKHMKKHDNEAQKSIKFEKFVDEDVIKVENGQFACIDCDKTFGKADHLAVHRREHTGECPHSCCMCEQSFMLRSQLLMHIREHRQSGVMMYLNLDAGEVCATMSEVKDVLTFSNTDDALSGTGTETSVYHREQRSKTKETSSHSGPQQQSIQSQSVNEAEKNCPHSVQNQTVTVKSNSDIIQHRYSHQNQILQPGQQLGNQDNRYQLHNPSSVSSDQNQNSPKFISVSINNQDIVSTSMAHHQIPLSHKKRELTSHPHLLKAPYSEAVPISMLGTPVNHVYSTSAKEGSYLFSSHNPSHPVSSNDQTPTGSQTAGPGDGHNNGHLQHGIQVMRPEQTHAPIAMTISNNLHPKTNSSHHDAPFSYTRTLMASPSTANVLPHHHPLSLPSTIHVQASRFNPDIHHTLSNFQLLPQTAFPENFHHM